MNRQGLLYTIIFTFAVSFVFVLVLAIADQQTKEIVAKNELVARQRAILNALSIPTANDEEVQNKYEAVARVDRGDTTLYQTTVDGTVLYAKEFAGAGLWGTITGVIGVTATMDRVTGIEIISQHETPGLGARIGEDWFKRQLAGERILDGRVEVGSAGDGEYDHENGMIDAVTGASRTSESMQKILDQELQRLGELIGGQS